MARPARMLAPIGIALVLAMVLVSCGDGNDEPQFRTIPLACEQVIDRLESRAKGWPDPASSEDLITVNNTLFTALDGLTDECDPEVFQRYDAIKCDYFSSVRPADEATGILLRAQQDQCEPDPGPAPDEPTATVEGPDATTLPLDRCEAARQALETEGIIPDASNMPAGCDT